MATIIGGPRYATSQESDSFFGSRPQANPTADLYDWFEQAFVNDPYKLAAGIDISPYMSGVTTAAGGMSSPQAIEQNRQAANTILQRMAAAGLAPKGWSPWSSFDDFNTRQNARGGGFTQGSSLGDFISGSVQHLGDTASELWSEPGFRQLALTAAGGAYAGSQAAPAAQAAGAAPTAAEGAGIAAGMGSDAATLAGSGFYSTGPGGLMPSAIAPIDPSFGGALVNTGAGSWAQPAISGGFTGATTGGALYGSTPGVGTSVPGGANVGGAATTGMTGILSSPLTLMAGGAALGGLGSSPGDVSTIPVEEGLPDWLMPYAKESLDRYATDLRNYNVDPYGVMPSAMQEFQKTIGGQYLDPSSNKYLEDYFRLGAERIKGSLSPSFGHMNAFGAHSGYNEALARGLGDFSVGLYGGAYDKERDRQSQLTAAAPSFLTQSSTAQFAPYQQYLGTLSSLGKKTNQPYFEGNPFTGILGGALAGGSLGAMFNSNKDKKNNPWGF